MPKKPVTRLQIAKNNEIALVIEQIIDADSAEVVLTIPRFSKLSESAANFHLMKREADLLNRRIIIESVDDKVIEMAETAGLESLNPILSKTQKRISDIRPATTEDYQIEDMESAPPPKTPTVPPAPKALPRASTIERPTIAEVGESLKNHRESKWSVKRSLVILIVAFVLVGGFAVAVQTLPKAEITIITKKSPWVMNDSITVSQDQNTAQLFTERRNLNMSFPASGSEHVRRYAKGKILVFNAYSSDPQPLVQRTRFVTPDGKVFRLTEGITVPAARVVDGKIVPTSIEADVVADQSGELYNIGPIEKFTVPGFQGSPKFNGFYGQSKTPMAGGFIGEAAVPTESDILSAKETIRTRLEDAIRSTLFNELPGEFKVIDGASNFKLLKEEVIDVTDAAGNFSVFAEAELDLVAFRENDIRTMLREDMRDEFGPEYDFHTLTITYGAVEADFGEGNLEFSVEATASVWRPIDESELHGRVMGQSEEELRSYIASLAGFEDGQVAFWPFWVSQVPERPSRVLIDIR